MKSVETEKKKIRIGEKLESAMWVTGEETPDQLKHHEETVQANFDEMAGLFGIIIGPVSYYKLNPGDPRVPNVPDHIQGWDVTLLVGEAEILGYKQAESGFTHELEDEDLEILRGVTRRVYALANYGAVLTDEQCDEYINSMGPEAALDTLRETMH